MLKKIFDGNKAIINLYNNSGSLNNLSRYCFVVPVDDGKIIYHTLTGAMYFINDNEDINDYKEELRNEGFFVNEDYDERKLVDDIRRLFNIVKGKEINSYTIVTTTDCNARCFYCYEKGIKKLSMDNNIAKEIAKYIINNADKKEVELKWFGGEPFYNIEAIDTICNELKNANVKYFSNTTSNGYYLDKKNINKVNDLWHLKDVQIAIDGTKDVYNKIKNYIDIDDNPYLHVLNNIKLLLKENVNVIIRLNVYAGNVDDLINLIDEINNFYDDKRNLSIRIIKLRNKDGSAYLDNEDINDKISLINKKIKEYGLQTKEKLYRSIVKNQCMADNDNCVVIYPDGNLGKCENYNENEIIGNIYKGITNNKIVATWKEKYEFAKCDKCILYPCCIRLKKCFWHNNKCDGEYYNKRVDLLKKQILNAYYKEVNNEN